ncbi:MAG: GAF domain-containing protein [Chloroflexi bacterium]|nr:GAF domain-containing protein [Chloroflexota bacterium]
MKNPRFTFAVKVALLYALIGTLWILSTDMIAARLFPNIEAISLVQTYKGWIFVIGTALALFILLNNKSRSRKEAQQNYGEIFDAAVEGIFRSSPEGRFLTANPAMAHILGYSSPAEMLELVKDIGTQIHLSHASRQEFIDLLNKQGSVQKFEARNLRKDGSIIWTSTNARVVHDAGGKTLYYEGFVTDITKQKSAELALQEAEARYRTVIEHMPATVYTQTPDRRSLDYFSSPQISAITGYSPEELTENPELLINLIHPGDRQRVQEENERTQQTRGPFNAEYRLISRDGHVVWIHDMATLICDDEGNPLYWQGLFLNISEQKKAEIALQEAESRYRVLVERLPAMVFLDVFDERQTSQYMSPRIKDILGYSTEEWMAESDLWENSLHPEDRERVLAEDFRTNQTGDPFRIEYRLRARDGHYVWIREEAYIIKGDDGTPLFWQGIMLDITDQKLAQEALRRRELILEAVGFAAEQFLKSPSWEDCIEQVLERLGRTAQASRVYMFKKSISPQQEILISQLFEWCDAGIEPQIGNTALQDMNFAEAGYSRWIKLFDDGLPAYGIVKELPPQEQVEFSREGILSIVCFPIQAGNDWWGFLGFDDCREEREWSAVEIEALRTAVSTLGAAIQRKSTQEAMFKSESSYKGLFNTVTDAIYIHDSEGRFLDVNDGAVRMYGYPKEYFIGKTPEVLGAPGKNDLDKINQAMSNAFHGESQKIEFWGQRGNGEIFPQGVRLYKGTYFGQDVVIAIAQDITERKHAEEALQRQLKELTVLHAIALAGASARNTDELIRRVTDIIGDTLYSDNCGILLLTDSGDMLKPHASYRGTTPATLLNEIPVKIGISGKVVVTGRPIRVGDVTKEPDYFEVTSGIHSELCVPISSGEKIFGVLNVESKQIDAFTTSDERLLNTIAGSLATALERLQLFELEKRRRKEAETLRRVTAALTTSVELNETYETILNSLSKLVEYTSASIELVKGEYLEIVAEHGLPKDRQFIGKTYLFRAGKWGTGLWNPVIIPDVQIDDRFEKMPGTEYIRSWMGVPLITQDKLIGYLNLDSDKVGFYQEEHAAIIQTFANQAAIAIENALLFQEEARRSKIIKALADIANEIATTREITPVLDKVTARACELLDASHVAIYILQDDQTTLKVVTASGSFSNELVSHTLKIGEGITGEIVSTGKAEIINDTANDPRRKKVPGTPEDDGIIETMMSAPLILRGKVIGAINAWRLRSNGLFNEAELTFLISIAHQASIAIESGRLFEETVRRAQESTAIAEVGRDITATLQLDLVLERIALYAKDLLRAETSAVYLHEINEQSLRAIAAIGKDAEEIKSDPLQIGLGILGSIAQRKSGEIVNNSMEDPRAITIKGTQEVPFEHLMGVSVLTKNQLTGLLVVWRTGKDQEFRESDLEFLTGLAQQAAVAIENARLFQAEQKRRQDAENLRIAATAITSTLEPQQVLNTILVALQQVVFYDSAAIFQLEGENARITAAKGFPETGTAINQVFPANNELFLTIKRSGQPLILENSQEDSRFEKWAAADRVRGWMGVPLIARGEVIGYITMDSFAPGAFNENDAALAQIFAHQAAAAIENVRLYTETRQRLEELEDVSRISFALRAAQDSEEMLPILLDEIKHSMDTDTASIWLYNPEKDELIQKASSGQLANLPRPNFKPSEGIAGWVFTSGKIHVSMDFAKDPMAHSENVKVFGKNWGGITVPIRTPSETIGAVMVAIRAPRLIESHHVRLMTTIAEITGNAIYRSTLYERSEEQIRQLITLREIDTAIASSFDLRVTLDIVTEHLLTKMGASAAAILIFSPESQSLAYFTGMGFHSPDILHKSLHINEGLAGKLFLAHNDIYIANLHEQTNFLYSNLILREGFISYYAVPLQSKGLTRGVLELYFRTPFTPNADWTSFIHTLAGQATIAIDNANLFENLQRSNQELSLAYDTTLEGWGKALELRDKETEGHTRRVSELTLKLARQMNIPEPELTHIRRGVLLHDIGKMGVPDNILRKEGPLTKGEWVEMRKHPGYAYDLLYPIPYLRASLDIPYSHHEWWDGSGYPLGLKGEEIPLPARIFTVVDVWDALLSDRPYRKSWPRPKVIKYLRSLSGKQFDPNILNVFLKMIQKSRPEPGGEPQTKKTRRTRKNPTDDAKQNKKKR